MGFFFFYQGLFNFRLSTRSDSMYEIIYYYFFPGVFIILGGKKVMANMKQ